MTTAGGAADWIACAVASPRCRVRYPQAHSAPGRLGGVGVNADDVDRSGPVKAGRHEGRQSALGLEAAVIRDDDRAVRRLRLGDHDDRARRVLEHPLDQPVVRLILVDGELEVGPQRHEDEVAGTGLAPITSCGEPTPVTSSCATPDSSQRLANAARNSRARCRYSAMRFS